MRVQSGQWRFILILLFIGLVIFAIVRAPKFLRAETNYIDENFDAYSTGDVSGQGNWTTSGSGSGYDVSTDNSLSPPNSLRVWNTNSTNTSSRQRTFDSGSFSAAGFDIWAQASVLVINESSCTSDFQKVNFNNLYTSSGENRSNGGVMGFACRNGDSVSYTYNSGSGTDEIAVLNYGQRYTITVNINRFSGISTHYIDGVQVATTSASISPTGIIDRVRVNRFANVGGALNVYIDNYLIQDSPPPLFDGNTRIVTLIEHHQTLATTTAFVEAIYDLTVADEPRYSHILYDFLNLDTNQQWTTTDPTFPSSGLSFGSNQSSFGGVIPPLTFFPPGMYLAVVGFVADPDYWGFSPFEDPDCYWDPFSPDHDCVLASPVVHFAKTFQFVVGTSIYGEYEDGTLVQPPTPEFEIDCSGETGLDFVVCKVGELLSDLFSWIMDQIKAFFGISGAVLQNAFNLLKEHFFSRAPWGYGLRIYEIICGQFSISTLTCSGPATSTLPTLIVTAPAWVEEHTGANFGAGIDWAPWGGNRFQFIQDSIEEQEVENIATTTDAWQSFLAKWRMTWNLLFALFLLYIVFGIQWTLESGREIDQKYGGL